MTQDERKMLEDLAGKIAQTPPPPRDPEAEDFIRQRIGSRPDALYLMTQTVLIQNIALQHAQEQLQQSQRQGGGSYGGGSFLGQSPDPGRSAGYGSQYAAPPPPQYTAPSPAAPSPQVAAPSGAPSFLKGAAQTAAGVAAGALAFEGIRSMFSHPGYGGGGGGFFGGGGIGGYAPVEETVVNNYYDAPTEREDYRDRDVADRDADSGNYSNDLGPTDDSANFDDSGVADNFDDSNSGGGDDFS
jgi:uncharacterized protein